MTTCTGLEVCVDVMYKCSNVSYRLVVVLRNVYDDLFNNPTPHPRFDERHSLIKL